MQYYYNLFHCSNFYSCGYLELFHVESILFLKLLCFWNINKKITDKTNAIMKIHTISDVATPSHKSFSDQDPNWDITLHLFSCFLRKLKLSLIWDSQLVFSCLSMTWHIEDIGQIFYKILCNLSSSADTHARFIEFERQYDRSEMSLSLYHIQRYVIGASNFTNIFSFVTRLRLCLLTFFTIE
jgi:hypothetical protein